MVLRGSILEKRQATKKKVLRRNGKWPDQKGCTLGKNIKKKSFPSYLFCAADTKTQMLCLQNTADLPVL